MSGVRTHHSRHTAQEALGAPAAPPQAVRADAGGLTSRRHDMPVKQARTIAVTGGKGGVGKSNLSVGLALCAARAGRRVGILDADFGLAKLHILLGLTPRVDLRDVLAGEARLADTLLDGPEGVRILPGASGLAEVANLDAAQRAMLLAGLEDISEGFDLMIVDTGAGIAHNVTTFVAAADEAVVVTTPEPTALADAYGLIKTAYAQRPGLPLHLLVNSFTSPDEADGAARRLIDVTQRFLGVRITYAGRVPADPAVGAAVRARKPFLSHTPDSPAALAFPTAAGRILGLEDVFAPEAAAATRPTGSSSVMPAVQQEARTTFAQRLASLFSRGRNL